MKKKFSILVGLIIGLSFMGYADNSTNGAKNTDIVIFSGGRPHRLIEVQPEGRYNSETQVLTIEFPVAGFEPYTLSVSSMYNTLDFYVTTPFVSVPINDTNVTIELQLETASGDMYYGSFEASSNTSTE